MFRTSSGFFALLDIVFDVFFGGGFFGFLVALDCCIGFSLFFFPVFDFLLVLGFLFLLFLSLAQQGGLSPPVAAGHSVTTLSPFTPCVDRAVPAWRGVAPTAIVYV